MTEGPHAAAQIENFEFAALQEAKNYRQALLEAFSEQLQGNVLEVGAGIGQIAAMLLQIRAITKLVSIEPDPRFVSRVRETLPGHDVVEGTIHDVASGQPWNAILSVNVLEHIEDDERELSTYARQLTAQRGALCLFVPARPEIYAPIDRDFGHFRRYTKPELRRKLDKAGFDVVRIHYYNLVGYAAWWLSFCLLKKRGFDFQAVRTFDRFIFPATHGFETRICRPPIGQSLLVIARARPGN